MNAPVRRRVRFPKKRPGAGPYVMLTAADAPTAELLQRLSVDFILVGDSLAMTVLGYPSTIDVTMDEMIHHAKAVRRGAKNAFIIGDLPLRGVRGPARRALNSAKRFVNQAGCNAVKIECGTRSPDLIRRMVRSGIPVLAHIGLRPQAFRDPGQYRVQGRDAASALGLLKLARQAEAAGAFAVLLECIPVPVARRITQALRIPTIGIGAGPFCDGQVLVFHDVVGLYNKMSPRYVRRYAKVEAVLEKALGRFIGDVRSRRFPKTSHGFKMAPAQEAFFLKESKRRED